MTPIAIPLKTTATIATIKEREGFFSLVIIT